MAGGSFGVAATGQPFKVMSSIAENPVLDLQSIADKRDVVQALARREAMRKANGLLFYRPHQKQDFFHRHGEIKRRYVRTGNRFGKSTMGSAEDCAWALGERIWYDKDDPARMIGLPKRATKGVIICADWDKAEEIFTDEHNGKLIKLLPKDKLIKCETNQSGNVDKVRVDCIWGGVSTIYLDTVKSFMSNAMGHESSDWDWLHIDEPCPKEMFEAYARGLMDREGSAWFTCTPITELWINDMFFPSGMGRKELDKPFQKNKDRIVITGTTFDNPTLSRASIELFSSELSPSARAARLYGKPSQLSGQIYDEFDPDVHVYLETPKGWADYDQPPENWTIRVSIDIHDGIPQAVLFAATSQLNQTYFWAECFDEIHIGRCSQRILEVLGGRQPYSIIADPRAWIENPRDGMTIADDFHANGIYCEPGPKDLVRGILKVKEMLKKRDLRGHPVLNFSQHLTETLHEFERYVYDPKTGKPYSKAPDHMMENLYRLCLNGLDWVDPAVSVPIIKPVEIVRPRLDLPKVSTSLPTKKFSLKGMSRYGRAG